MEITNVSGQTLVFPDGTEVRRGDLYTMTDADMSNAGVKGWIDDEWITEATAPVKKKGKAAAADEPEVTV